MYMYFFNLLFKKKCNFLRIYNKKTINEKKKR